MYWTVLILINILLIQNESYLCTAASGESDENRVEDKDLQIISNVMKCFEAEFKDKRDVCLKNGITKLIPQLKQGYSPLNLPPTEPFSQQNLQIDFTQHPFVVKANVKEVTIHGLSGIQIKNIRSNISDTKVQFESRAYFPQMIVTGSYKAQVQVSTLFLEPEGTFDVKLEGVTGVGSISGKIREDTDDKFLVMETCNVSNVRLKNFNANITGLVPNEDLNVFILNFINDNWKIYYEESIAQTKTIWEPLALEMINNVFERVPFKSLDSD